MKITPFNKTNQNSNFRAKHIANAVTSLNGEKQIVQLFELGEKDINFAQKMYSKINLKALYPECTDNRGFSNWIYRIKSAIENIQNQNVILAVHNKRPCGIMAYYKEDDNLILENLAKWRTVPSVNTNYVGKILMRHLFEKAHEDGAKNILLIPNEATPRNKNCIDFYSALNFTPHEDEIHMELKNVHYMLKCAQLENFFDYKKIDSKGEVDLFKTYSLKFYKTIRETIADFLHLDSKKQ